VRARERGERLSVIHTFECVCVFLVGERGRGGGKGGPLAAAASQDFFATKSAGGSGAAAVAVAVGVAASRCDCGEDIHINKKSFIPSRPASNGI